MDARRHGRGHMKDYAIIGAIMERQLRIANDDNNENNNDAVRVVGRSAAN